MRGAAAVGAHGNRLSRFENIWAKFGGGQSGFSGLRLFAKPGGARTVRPVPWPAKVPMEFFSQVVLKSFVRFSKSMAVPKRKEYRRTI